MTSQPSGEKEPRVLIAEDEILVAEDLAEILRRFGFSVIAAVESGEAAVELAIRERPDLVLMDIRLAGPKDGIQAAAEIRKRISVPIIYLTAYSDRITLDRAKSTEPDGYVLKPFHERQLQVAIEVAMCLHASQHKERAAKK